LGGRELDKPSIDPKDVASATGVGAAARLGAARYRAKAGGAHAGAGTAAKKPKRRRRGSLWLTSLLFVFALVAMLALMIHFGR
jgi:hypothetical protein